MNWGHATSTDLVKWNFDSISVAAPAVSSDSMDLSPWWGTAVIKGDAKYAWVDSWGEGIYRYNTFSNGEWKNKEAITGADNLKKSEPFVFWNENTDRWNMVAYNRTDSTINFLNSPEGLHWTKTSSFNFKFGFVSMIELPVDRKPDDKRWLFITESGNYLLGSFDGNKLNLLGPLRQFNYGDNVGGSVCFNDRQKDRVIMVSELKSEQQADLPSNGQLSFPVEISLHSYSSKWYKSHWRN